MGLQMELVQDGQTARQTCMVWSPDPAGKPWAWATGLWCWRARLPLRAQAEAVTAENWERVICRGLVQFCWQSKPMDIWHKVQKQHFCLALFAFRANTGRLEFPLGLSPTQTGLAEAFN